MRLASIPVCALTLAVTASSLAAQDRSVIRQLGPVVARASEALSIAAIRPTSRGVLVNDQAKRRVLLFDSMLSAYIVVADSTPATGNAYGGRSGGLLAYKGDSSLFTDAASLSMLVIDPDGKVARVMSIPRSEDAMFLAGPFGGATYDGRGALVYRGGGRPMMRNVERMAAVGGGGGGGAPRFAPPEIPDSMPVLRIDLATRRLDTLGYVKTPKVKMDIVRTDNGVTMTSQINPLPVIDEWAALSDGTVAFLRGRDYHVDWVNADGTRTASPKIAFDWQRLTDEDKVALIDSVKAARERMGTAAPGVSIAAGGAGAGAGGMGAAGPQIMIQTRDGAGPGGGPPPSGGAGQRMQAQVNFVPPEELPDYKPAFFSGAVRADVDGNIWVRTIPTRVIPGGPVYDVINRRGELVERVQIPANRTIVGFGPGGFVYLAATEAGATYLEKARLR